LGEKLVQFYNFAMCARATLKSPDRLTELRELRVTFPGGLKPRFNIAPTTPILTARLGTDGARECSMRRWGLMPSFTKQLAKTPALINARAERLAEKFTFRHSLQRPPRVRHFYGKPRRSRAASATEVDSRQVG
jgi:putative SOS response-associated peptidase YedK